MGAMYMESFNERVSLPYDLLHHNRVNDAFLTMLLTHRRV